MAVAHPFAMHYQQTWEERAGNPPLPLWLRVASLAYGRHLRNGHANFRPGEVATCLMTIEPSTGEITQPTRQQVSRAIKAAVDYGFLAPDSGSECLVVPAHSIRGGRGTEATEHIQCPVHVKKAEAARKRAAQKATKPELRSVA